MWKARSGDFRQSDAAAEVLIFGSELKTMVLLRPGVQSVNTFELLVFSVNFAQSLHLYSL